MNKIENFKNGANEEGEIVIPFFGGLAYPMKQIENHFKGFLKLTCVVTLFNAIVSLLLGRNFLCGLGIDTSGFYCSFSILAMVVSVFSFIGGTAWYINRWYSVSESGERVEPKPNLKDIKTVGCILFYFALWFVAGWTIYLLNVRKPAEDWREELLFFFILTMILLSVLIFLVNSVLFVRFLQGEKWMCIRSSFWPVFDNLYKILGWFLFYFLMFAYVFHSISMFWVQNEWLPLWVNILAGELCFYFMVYICIAVFISSLAYQAKYIFDDSKKE